MSTTRVLQPIIHPFRTFNIQLRDPSSFLCVCFEECLKCLLLSIAVDEQLAVVGEFNDLTGIVLWIAAISVFIESDNDDVEIATSYDMHGVYKSGNCIHSNFHLHSFLPFFTYFLLFSRFCLQNFIYSELIDEHHFKNIIYATYFAHKIFRKP